MNFDYDVIVVGAGHAGCEAAVASAKLGARTLLVTADLNKVAQMSCNPAVGGIAKGQIVREIDALGGEMGIVADRTAIQFRMLNRSKGPAVWSPRVQSDRAKYIDTWRHILENTDNLVLFQDMVTAFEFDDDDNCGAENDNADAKYNADAEGNADAENNAGNPVGGNDEKGMGKKKISGVVTALGFRFKAKKVVLTAGTFLNGLMHFGATKISGGRISESASTGLTEQLRELEFSVLRMKTGTPARIDSRSIDFSLAERQDGDDKVAVFDDKSEPEDSGLSKSELDDSIPDKSVIRGFNPDQSVMGGFNPDKSVMEGLNPDKGEKEREVETLVELVERDFHKFSFLPDVHRELRPRSCYIVHTNPEVHAILHDNLDSSPLYNGQIKSIGPRYCPSIETKIVTFSDKESHQLFLEPEGETTHEFYINGFSSSLPWEVQLKALQRVPALRDVHFYRPGYAIEYDYFDPTQLTHDLQTKYVQGLYFAGQVNGTTGYEEAAAQGLMAGINAALAVRGEAPFILGRDEAYIGVLIDDLVTKGVDEPYRMFTSRAEYRILLRQDDADMRLTPKGAEIGLATPERLAAMEAKRRQRDELIEWCRTFTVKMGDKINEQLSALGTAPLTASVRLYDLLKRPGLDFAVMSGIVSRLRKRLDEIEPGRRAEIVEAAEILIKYDGYIQREKDLAEKARRLEYVKLPADMDYHSLTSLSTEARQKLTAIRPATIGQASRIPGVSPADINILLILLHR